MSFPKTLLALSLCLSAMACSTSGPSTSPLPDRLAQAEAKVDDKLSHPQPPAVTLLCQDGSDPKLLEGNWECPPPPEVREALESAQPLEQVARLIGALRKETNLRFRLREAVSPDAGTTTPLPASPAP